MRSAGATEECMESTFLALPGHFPAAPPRCCRDINSAVLSHHFFNPVLTPTSNAHEITYIMRHGHFFNLSSRSLIPGNPIKRTRGAGASGEGVAGETKMRRSSVLALLTIAFVGGNLFLGVSFNARSTVKSSDPASGTVELDGRRLKERVHVFTNRRTRGLQNVRTDDYQPVDPSPSSKATIRSGPIEHGTPLLPYVPRYTPPPGHPKDVPPADSPASPAT